MEIAFNLLHPLEQELSQKQFLIATLYEGLRLASERVEKLGVVSLGLVS